MMIDLLAVDESAMLRCWCRTLTYVAGRKTGDGQTGEIPLVSRFPLFELNSQTKLLWPNQAQPREKLWNEWRTVLKDAFLAPNIIRANKARSALPLQQPLGPWMGTRHHTQRQWMHYVSEDGNTLYVKRPTGFHCHTRIPTLFHSHRYQIEKIKAHSKPNQREKYDPY
jgi:hypothetical protein